MPKPIPPPPSQNPRLSAHQVILRPLVTEKGVHKANRQNAYAFVVATEAAKLDVRLAIEELFNVTVTKVAIQNRKGKIRRSRMRRTSTRNWKKAIVTLRPEFKISFF